MNMVLYDNIMTTNKMMYADNMMFTTPYYGVRDETEPYSTEAKLYEDLLDALAKELFKDKFALCLQIRDGQKVLYEFPKVPCPALFLEQLRIKKI